MSASIKWEPAQSHGVSLPVNAPSSFLSAMERFQNCSGPWALASVDIAGLRGLAAGLQHETEAIMSLIDAIERHGVVRVWAEY